MRTISRIEGTLPKISKDGSKYYKTLAVLDDGDEVWGFSNRPDTFQVGDLVERWYNDEFNEAQMRHRTKKDEE